jgi:hypothetical protein
MEVDHRLYPDLTVGLIGRYGLRLYNDVFAERDTHFYTVGPRVRYHAVQWLTMTLSSLYERGLADGRNQPQFSDDVSYDLYIVSFDTEIEFAPALTLELSYLYARKDFTSDLPGDSHVGRQDRTHQGRAELRYHISSRVSANLSFQQTQRSSTNALRDFNDSIVSIGGEYRF